MRSSMAVRQRLVGASHQAMSASRVQDGARA